MIDRVGQVWEDRDGALVYLVLETVERLKHNVFYHRVLFLMSSISGYSVGEIAYEFESYAKSWEETTRVRLT